MKHLKKLLLLLALLVAGVQSAQADYVRNREWINKHADVVNVPMGGVTYEVCHIYWKIGYVDQSLGAQYEDDPGYKERSIKDDDALLLYWTTGRFSPPDDEYYASVVAITGSGEITIPESINNGGVDYPVKYIGFHTEQTLVEKDTTYYQQTWLSGSGYYKTTTCKYYGYTQTPVTLSLSNSGITKLTFNGDVTFKGTFSLQQSNTSVEFKKDVTFTKSTNFTFDAPEIMFGGVTTIEQNATLFVYNVSELRFNKLFHEGMINCPSLTDIYFSNSSSDYLPAYSGSFSKYFANCNGSDITCHMPKGTTANRIQQLKTTAVFCDFKDIVAGESDVNYTLVSDGNARINFVELKGNAGYVSATSISQIASSYSGSKSGTAKAGGNYAVEIMDVDFDTKNVQLLRNGHVATLEPYEDQGRQLRFYEDLDLQQNVRYEVSVSDKICTVSFSQTGYTGRILYQKSYNGKTSTGVVTGASPTVTCAQGSQLKLTIPYDQYTPNKLYLGGSEVTMTKANGEAIATITLPASASAQIDLTWQAPQQTFTHHQPEIMIMRSGEGDILFKGLCLPEEQAAEAYEQQFGYPADENGVVVSAVSNCPTSVTTVTVPDYDYLGRGEGYTFDAMEWGFQAEITPVAGQTLKTLLVGYIDDEDGRETIIWEDLLYGANYGMYVHPEYNYVTYNESTNTYTFNWGFDEMNVWIGDYVLNIGMGPEETAVETGKKLNFVRKGGRGHAWIYWHDTDYDYYFDEDGSSTKVIPNEQLTDLQMTVQLNEGESMHVYKNGVDITGQFQQRESSDEFWVELDKESATYTILIDDAPNANPSWTIHNATEGDVIVEQTLKNGTTETATYAGNLNDLVIDDTQVSKVTLKVYAENQNDSKPVRVLLNGQDVSYQFNTMVNDGDGLRLCYEVPVSELTNCSWDISYNTDHAQTFVVKGGTRDLLVEVECEILQGEPNLSIFRDNGPATIYLPSFNSEYNTYINMTVYVDTYEGITIKRNGLDVTNLFSETAESGGRYYELNISEGDMEGNSTVGLFGFDIREAAVWEIVYKSLDEQIKAHTIQNPDKLELDISYTYLNGTATSYTNSNEYHKLQFDDTDRENIQSVTLTVPFRDADNMYYPIRVMLNGEDITEQGDYDSSEGTLAYDIPTNGIGNWEISRDVSHRQTFIRKGGTKTWNVEVEFDFPADGYERYFYPDQIGTPLYVDFPAYHSVIAPYAYISIDVEDGSTFTVLRNGVEVAINKFKRTNGAAAGFTRYMLSEVDNGGSDTQAALGFQFRDPAVWQITIGDESSDDENAVEYMFIGDFNKVYASADYNNDVTYEGFEFMQQDVVGYYIGKVVENGQAANSDGAVEFWMPNANDTFRAYRNNVNMTNLFVPNGSGGWLLTSNEAWVHAPAHWVIIREDDLMKYDVNRDSNITIADVTKLVNKILGKE